MTTLLLIRHGTTAATGKRLGGRTGAELDEGGVQQAKAAGERIADLPVKAVYASPLTRTWQTAEHVAAPFKLPVREAEGLLEVDYGRWTDRTLAQVSRTRRWKVVQSTPSLTVFPEGESIRGAQARATDEVERLVAAHRRQVIAAVSHADVIKAIVAFYLGQPLDLFQRLVIDPGSVTILDLGVGTRPALTRFNDNGGLDGAAYRRSARG